MAVLIMEALLDTPVAVLLPVVILALVVEY